MVLFVEVLAVLITVATVGRTPISGTHLIWFGVLAVGSIVHLEAVRGIERAREGVRSDSPYVDLKSIWTFAAVLLLPVPLAVGLVVLTFLHVRLRVVTMQAFRLTYSGATVVLATLAASAVLHTGLPEGVYPGLPSSAGGVCVVIVAAFMRWFINHGLIVAVILLSNPAATARGAMGSFSTNVVEVAAVSLGAVTALAVANDPWFVLLVLPPLLVLHRSLLLHQYELAARTDHKTGLANTLHWTQAARAELARAERDRTGVGILMLDLDHFKVVNDTHGHLAGDAVLKAVADTLRRECRDHDVVGRFGGEEFVVLLPGLVASDLLTVAERLRREVGALAVASPPDGDPTLIRVTTSIGATSYPNGGHDLDELLLAADSALYQAKTAGRDRVRMAPTVLPLVPRAREADRR